MSDTNDAKFLAAHAALAELPESGIIGLGSGSTAKLFIDGVGALVRGGRQLVGVPTSQASRTQAMALGIPLLSDDGPWDIAVTVDGADEVAPNFDVIKGGGAAHTREKIINYSSCKNIIIVDGTKLSAQLGTNWAVPVEVLLFASLATRKHLERLGNPVLRVKNGAPVRTDSGNCIYDLQCGPIAHPHELDRALHDIPGVVETGLFIGRVNVVFVARDGGVERLVRS
ncbi:MAG: ribose-5-phosphate isomerase RpiA [Gemmatimonadota bacterium]|nr:ribose-5-phosphate isomerase RpiA [Gemmatimonadota bacterium]